jgi:hypothetical protein
MIYFLAFLIIGMFVILFWVYCFVSDMILKERNDDHLEMSWEDFNKRNIGVFKE